MLHSLNINNDTWLGIRGHYQNSQHRLSTYLNPLVLVDERWSGPLNEEMQLRRIRWL
jgi:hypothetical protein